MKNLTAQLLIRAGTQMVSLLGQVPHANGKAGWVVALINGVGCHSSVDDRGKHPVLMPRWFIF